MNKIKILLAFFCFFSFQSKATVWTVNVSNFQFSPQTLNVVVGDQIHWVNISGFHSTTSQMVPAGAAPWSSGPPLTTFDYTVTKAGNYTYFCTVHGFAVMNGSFTATGVLPVILSSFNIATQDKKPLIIWSTATESNINYFSIRKSINGIEYKEIGNVRAIGNSTIARQYSFIDDHPGETNYLYYNLAIVDNDGKTQLFPIKLYKNNNSVPKLITSLSPNPITGSGTLVLQFNADKPGIMQVKVMDMQGKVVSINEQSAVQGINNGHMHLGSLPPGSYTINFDLGGLNESYKITKN